MLDICTVLGFLGVILIMLGYVAITFDVVGVHTYTYVNLNFWGAVLLAQDAYDKNNWSGLVINSLFIVVALVLLGITIKRKRLSKGEPKKKRRQ